MGRAISFFRRLLVLCVLLLLLCLFLWLLFDVAFLLPFLMWGYSARRRSEGR
jgi:hypothetical protein